MYPEEFSSGEFSEGSGVYLYGSIRKNVFGGVFPEGVFRIGFFRVGVWLRGIFRGEIWIRHINVDGLLVL